MKSIKTLHVQHLSSFGMLTEIRNSNGMTGTLVMDMPEISRFLGALEAYVQARNRVSDIGLLKSLSDVHERFSVSGREHIRITADVVIAQHGVTLEPIDISVEDLKAR